MASYNWLNSSKKLGIKWKVLKAFLLEKEYIYLTEKTKKINCYDKFSTNGGSGLFYKKIDVFNKPNGDVIKDYQTKVTDKGLKYLREELKKEGLINGDNVGQGSK